MHICRIELSRVNRMASIPKSLEAQCTDSPEERQRTERRIVEEKRRLRGIEKRHRQEQKLLKKQEKLNNQSFTDHEVEVQSSNNTSTIEGEVKVEASVLALRFTHTHIHQVAADDTHIALQTETSTAEVKEEQGQQPPQQPSQILHRYCHVYKQGELEDLCSRYHVILIAMKCTY